jgi:hypothetical protein
MTNATYLELKAQQLFILLLQILEGFQKILGVVLRITERTLIQKSQSGNHSGYKISICGHSVS